MTYKGYYEGKECYKLSRDHIKTRKETRKETLMEIIRKLSKVEPPVLLGEYLPLWLGSGHSQSIMKCNKLQTHK